MRIIDIIEVLEVKCMSDTSNTNNFEFPFQKKHINACSNIGELLPL